MRTQLKLRPGTERTLKAVNVSPVYCDVIIPEEEITLRFERLPDGVIRCTGRMRETSDSPERASRAAFEQARRFAVRRMNAIRDAEGNRSHDVNNHIIIDVSTVAECTMSYHGNQYTFSCDVVQPLTWEGLWLSAAFANSGQKLQLTDEEFHTLKQRAFGKIKQRRKDDYEDGGLGILRPNPQISFSL